MENVWNCCALGTKLTVIWILFPKTVLCLNMSKVQWSGLDSRRPGPVPVIMKSDRVEYLSYLHRLVSPCCCQACRAISTSPFFPISCWAHSSWSFPLPENSWSSLKTVQCWRVFLHVYSGGRKFLSWLSKCSAWSQLLQLLWSIQRPVWESMFSCVLPLYPIYQAFQAE